MTDTWMDAKDQHLYDKQGRPISYRQYASLKHDSDEYRRIGDDTVGDTWVSTVWLGLDHGASWREGHKPVIFETMIFGGPMDLETWRYTSEAAARAGHRVIVKLVRRRRHGQIKARAG